MGTQDGDIQIALKQGHQPTDGYVRKLREELPRRFPGVTFSFPPADIVSQILNFGSRARIELQIRANDLGASFDYANMLLPKIRAITGIADVRIQQSRRKPVFDVDVDRTRAQQIGITMRDITTSLVANLAGSSQVAPIFWLNPRNGVQHPIVIQTPQYRLDTLPELAKLPVGGSDGNSQVLGAAQAVDVTSGATLMQILVDNAKGELLPGAFANVSSIYLIILLC